MLEEERVMTSLAISDAVALLSSATVGRVVFSVAALPAIAPITFAVHGDAVVMRTSAHTRLASAADGGVLAFEVDDVNPAARTGWSVVVTGVAEVVRDPVQQAVIHGLVAPYAPGENDVAVRLPLTVVTGRRVEGVLSPAPGDRTSPL
ncbi:MAG: pyridoxamine 5'-phosphate oxidase family protein [Actinomycetia bacterium]|nr:pyridoxamine 5'-phosphate oxidase family protein [Actinomycetes bacterium]